MNFYKTSLNTFLFQFGTATARSIESIEIQSENFQEELYLIDSRFDLPPQISHRIGISACFSELKPLKEKEIKQNDSENNYSVNKIYLGISIQILNDYQENIFDGLISHFCISPVFAMWKLVTIHPVIVPVIILLFLGTESSIQKTTQLYSVAYVRKSYVMGTSNINAQDNPYTIPISLRFRSRNSRSTLFRRQVRHSRASTIEKSGFLCRKYFAMEAH